MAGPNLRHPRTRGAAIQHTRRGCNPDSGSARMGVPGKTIRLTFRTNTWLFVRSRKLTKHEGRPEPGRSVPPGSHAATLQEFDHTHCDLVTDLSRRSSSRRIHVGSELHKQPDHVTVAVPSRIPDRSWTLCDSAIRNSARLDQCSNHLFVPQCGRTERRCENVVA
jgi:hypothetical protein